MARGRAKGPARDGAKERLWRKHLASQQRGELSARTYCQRHQLSEASFYAWRREVKRRDAAAAQEQRSPASASVMEACSPSSERYFASPFVELAVRAIPGNGAIEIVLPNGVRVLIPPGSASVHVREVLLAVREAGAAC